MRSWPERRWARVGGVGGEDEEGAGGAVLLGEAGLDGVGVGVEGGEWRRGRVRRRDAGAEEEEVRAEEQS